MKFWWLLNFNLKKRKKSLVLESWTPVQLTEYILSYNHHLIKELFIEITKRNQGKGFLWVTQLDKNGHFLGLFNVIKLLIRLNILEHLLFPFIAQQNLNPSGYMGFKTPNYCDSVRETSFLLKWKRNQLGKPLWHVSRNWSLKGGLWCSRIHTVGAADPSLTDSICYIAFLSCHEFQLSHPQNERQELAI